MTVNNLRARAIAAMERETRAKEALQEASDNRKAALIDYNDAEIIKAGFVAGSTIVEVPHRYSWVRDAGKTEFFVVVAGSMLQLDRAIGSVVTKANRKHMAQYKPQSFDIEKAKDTGRRLTNDN